MPGVSVLASKISGIAGISYLDYSQSWASIETLAALAHVGWWRQYPPGY